MPRKRKVSVQDENQPAPPPKGAAKKAVQSPLAEPSPMDTKAKQLVETMLQAQMNESYFKKCKQQIKELYERMDHKTFMEWLIRVIGMAMQADENDEVANRLLRFCAHTVVFFEDGRAENEERSHPAVVSTFDWLMGTTSEKPHLRFRICQFVNLLLNSLGPEAQLDDNICNNIQKYMVERLRDTTPNVRMQATLALTRLQDPEANDCPVVRSYAFHIENDPSSKVRQAVVTSLGRNNLTIPHVIGRLWDIDEKVRRHTIIQMSSYPVKTYKVEQRLKILEQGMNDNSEIVRKAVINIMLPNWIEAYQRDYVRFVAALKIDANEKELKQFKKIANIALQEIFKKQKFEDILAALKFCEDEDIARLVPLEKLNVEMVIFWQAVVEYCQNSDTYDVDEVLPDLTVYSRYIGHFLDENRALTESSEKSDIWERMNFQFILLSLLEILKEFDYGDETGREALKTILNRILNDISVNEAIVKVIVEIVERLIEDTPARLQYFVQLVLGVMNQEPSSVTSIEATRNREIMDQCLEKADKSLQMRISALKFRILDLQESERTFVDRKDYQSALAIKDQLQKIQEEYENLMRTVISETGGDSTILSVASTITRRKITTETIVKCLQICYFMVASRATRTITLEVLDLYRQSIAIHTESSHVSVRIWALKCGTTYAMMCEQLSKEVFDELYRQFRKTTTPRIWQMSIEGLFELLDRYGCEHFELMREQEKSKSSKSRLYNQTAVDDEDETENEDDTTKRNETNQELLSFLAHLLDNCEDDMIRATIVEGYCRLLLRGHIASREIATKLMLKYFNPATDDELQQKLGIFFECVIKHKKQELMQDALLPTVFDLMESPFDSPLQEVEPEKVIRFVINATQPEFCSPGLSIHTTLALQFLKTMQDNLENKDLIKILSKEMLALEISDDPLLRSDLKTSIDNIVASLNDTKLVKSLIMFKSSLDGGKFKTPSDLSSKTSQVSESIDTQTEHMSDIEEEEEAAGAEGEVSAEYPPILVETSAEGGAEAGTRTTFGRENTTAFKNLRRSTLPPTPGGGFKVPTTTVQGVREEDEAVSEIEKTPVRGKPGQATLMNDFVIPETPNTTDAAEEVEPETPVVVPSSQQEPQTPRIATLQLQEEEETVNPSPVNHTMYWPRFKRVADARGTQTAKKPVKEVESGENSASSSTIGSPKRKLSRTKSPETPETPETPKTPKTPKTPGRRRRQAGNTSVNNAERLGITRIEPTATVPRTRRAALADTIQNNVMTRNSLKKLTVPLKKMPRADTKSRIETSLITPRTPRTPKTVSKMIPTTNESKLATPTSSFTPSSNEKTPKGTPVRSSVRTPKSTPVQSTVRTPTRSTDRTPKRTPKSVVPKEVTPEKRKAPPPSSSSSSDEPLDKSEKSEKSRNKSPPAVRMNKAAMARMNKAANEAEKKAPTDHKKTATKGPSPRKQNKISSKNGDQPKLGTISTRSSASKGLRSRSRTNKP